MSVERSRAPTKSMPNRIEVGQRLPTVAARRVGNGEIILPDDVEDGWAVLLLYRGHWCLYCRQQLVDFQDHLARFEGGDVHVSALSSDPEPEARATVEKHGIEYPVGYGLEPRRMREVLGTYLGEDDEFVQAAGFVLRPGGRVALAAYSTGAVGRLVATDVLGLIDHLRGLDSPDA